MADIPWTSPAPGDSPARGAGAMLASEAEAMSERPGRVGLIRAESDGKIYGGFQSHGESMGVN